LLATLSAFLVATACGDEGSSSEIGLVPDGGSLPVPPDAQALDAESAPPTSTMRLAHLAPGTGAIDFCYQGAKKGTFVGPVIRGTLPVQDAGAEAGLDADDDDAGDAGDDDPGDAGDSVNADDAGELPPRSSSYRTVSRYYTLQAAGPITIAIIPAGATSCANPIASGAVTLDPGKLSTVALFARPADGGTLPSLAAFTDDQTIVSEKIRVRVVHAALGRGTVTGAGPLAVRAVAAKTTVLADCVEPRHVASASAVASVDVLGYLTAPPVPGPTVLAIGPAAASADAGFEPWQSKPAALGLVGESLHTAFVLTGETDSSFEIVWCADTTTSGDQTACAVVR
jgi:hypothetical protein